jgi:hypothetical protein
MRSSPIADRLERKLQDDQAIDRMPIRLIVRLERALGSCEFCTGLIQLTARRLNLSSAEGRTSGSFSGHG